MKKIINFNSKHSKRDKFIQNMKENIFSPELFFFCLIRGDKDSNTMIVLLCLTF